MEGEMLSINNVTQTEDSIELDFGEEDKIILSRNLISGIYNKKGEKNDLNITINGFTKVVHTLEYKEDNSIKLNFK